MTEPPVLGIDTNSFGFHFCSSQPIDVYLAISLGGGGTDTHPVEHGWYLSREKDAQARRQAAFGAATGFFSVLPEGAAVFVEEPLVLPKNIETTRKLLMMGGVLEAAFLAANPDATWFWVSLSTWRKEVLGKGAGRKEEMKGLAVRHVQSGWAPSRYDELSTIYTDQPDLYDAACIMTYGLEQLATGRVMLR